jgi:hypothetical protein
MLVQLLAALMGDAVFGAVTACRREFLAEMERYFEERRFVPLAKIPVPPAR